MSEKAIVDLKGHMEIINMLTAKCNQLAEQLAAAKEQARQAAIAEIGRAVEARLGVFSCACLRYVENELDRLSTLPPTHVVVPVEWLREAADDVADWGAYASDYFQQKHDYDGTVNKWKQRYEASRKP